MTRGQKKNTRAAMLFDNRFLEGSWSATKANNSQITWDRSDDRYNSKRRLNAMAKKGGNIPCLTRWVRKQHNLQLCCIVRIIAGRGSGGEGEGGGGGKAGVDRSSQGRRGLRIKLLFIYIIF